MNNFMLRSAISPANRSLWKGAQAFPAGMKIFQFKSPRGFWRRPSLELSVQRIDRSLQGNREEVAMVNIAIYCRTDKESHESISEQRAALEGLVQAWLAQGKVPGLVTRIFEDDGFCDSSLSRPGLSVLRAEARARVFDLVIIANQSRFSRSTSQLFTLGREFLESEVRAISLHEKEDGRVESKSVFPHIEEAVSIMRPRKESLHGVTRAAVGE
jgi:hypothetical protein